MLTSSDLHENNTDGWGGRSIGATCAAARGPILKGHRQPTVIGLHVMDFIALTVWSLMLGLVHDEHLDS